MSPQQGMKKPSKMCANDTGCLYIAHGREGTKSVAIIEKTTSTFKTKKTPYVEHQVSSPGRLVIHQTKLEHRVTWLN